MAAGFNLVANPFDDNAGNYLTNKLSLQTDGTRVFLWDVAHQIFSPPATFSASSGTWNTNFSLPFGKGFAVYAPKTWTNTFVGQVSCGTNHNLVVGANRFSLLGCSIPTSFALGSGSLHFQGTDGDEVYLFKSVTQSYSDAFSYFTGYGWFDPSGVADTNGPVLAVGQPFFVQHSGQDYDWIQIFNFPNAAPAPDLAASSITPEVRSIHLQGKNIVLQVQENGTRFDIQFSSDGAVWSTLAVSQKGIAWTGPRPDSPQGYFRAVPTLSKKGTP
jgi:hypothetical protein